MDAPISRLPEALFQRWIHSHEEDVEGIKVYHTSDYNFPRSRGRRGFDIRKDGTFIRYDIAPADGSAAVEGRWKSRGAGRVEGSFPDEPGESHAFNIVSCDGKTLKIKLYSAESRY